MKLLALCQADLKPKQEAEREDVAAEDKDAAQTEAERRIVGRQQRSDGS